MCPKWGAKKLEKKKNKKKNLYKEPRAKTEGISKTRSRSRPKKPWLRNTGFAAFWHLELMDSPFWPLPRALFNLARP